MWGGVVVCCGRGGGGGEWGGGGMRSGVAGRCRWWWSWWCSCSRAVEDQQVGTSHGGGGSGRSGADTLRFQERVCENSAAETTVQARASGRWHGEPGVQAAGNRHLGLPARTCQSAVFKTREPVPRKRFRTTRATHRTSQYCILHQFIYPSIHHACIHSSIYISLPI